MKFYFVVFCLMALVLSNHSNAQSKKGCDCSTTPYTPDSCVNICYKKILAYAKPAELELILGLSTQLSNKISYLTENKNPYTLHGYIRELSRADSVELIRAFKGLTPSQTYYLNLETNKREKLANNMQSILQQKDLQ